MKRLPMPGLLALALVLAATAAGASSTGPGEAASSGGEAAGHSDPVTPLLIPLIVILLGAKLGGEAFERLGQPAVLGELIVGVLLGNADYLFGIGLFEPLRAGVTHDYLAIFSGLGVLFLLFETGLESNLDKMLKVGGTATAVAVVGVLAPWILGYLVGVLLLPAESIQAHVFLGAILTATSVGITARVFKDLGRVETGEARIILGAAVIDDILGLIILAVLSGMLIEGVVSFGGVTQIVVKSALFLGAALLVGQRAADLVSRFFGLFRVRGMKLISALAICFFFSWVSSAIGLASIVGAFAAGLILEEATFVRFRKEQPLHELLAPVSSVFIPVFFVVMGIDVRLAAFANAEALLLAGALTVAALAGKQVCGLVVRDRTLDRLSIGIGMIPRGEVGLIFAGIGRGLGVVNDALYAACVIMVIVTTFVAPIGLQYRMKRRGSRSG